MLAVIETGGKQYIVKKGEKVKIEKLEVKDGDKYIFDRVLLKKDDKGTLELGYPYLKGGEVESKVLQSEGKEDKIRVVKYGKKEARKMQGHRQRFTEVEITKI